MVPYVWTLPYSAYNKSVLTFIAGSLLLPLAFLFSRVFKTQWSAKDNPLDPLGLWLNFAQLFYFPILAIVLLQEPRLFLVCYVIITGAHLFPYAWFYDEKPYAIFAGIIAVGGTLLNLFLAATEQYFDRRIYGDFAGPSGDCDFSILPTQKPRFGEGTVKAGKGGDGVARSDRLAPKLASNR